MNISGQEKPACQFPECPPVSTDQSSKCRFLGFLGSRPRPSVTKLEQEPLDFMKVAMLEREVQKQKELGIMYMERLEKTQEYVRYCHEMAKESGFLDLLINHNDAKSRSPPPTPEVPANTVHQDTDLTSLIDRAKANGWFIEPREIELLEQVAEGTTAIIYRGVWRGSEVAVKCMTPEFFHSNENGVNFFTQEVELLSKQRHCFVMQLMGACLVPPDYAWLVTELMDTTLKEWLHGPGKRRKEREIDLPPLEERVRKALEIAQAMVYLHEQKPMLIHRDLKPSNIFLDAASHVKIADFGHARFLIDDEKALTGDIGTYVYMAPEIFMHRPYDEKCDVFSFGIILNELITGNHPYIETDYGAYKIAMEVSESRLRPALPEEQRIESRELIDLICLCWDGDASNRPSFATITCTLKKIFKTITEAT